MISAAGGAAELFTDGADGIGVAPGDSAALAGAVRRLAGDRHLRDRMAAAARRTAEARFDATGYGPQALNLYRDLRTAEAAHFPRRKPPAR